MTLGQSAKQGAETRRSGIRHLSPGMFATLQAHDAGGSSAVACEPVRPHEALNAFKAAAPYLRIKPRIIQTIDWLFAFTQSQDWGDGHTPVVWPSAAVQRDALGLSVTQVKALNRQLVELGLVVFRDSPSGKRFGVRDATGKIITAYGFDLSPMRSRMREFQAVAAEGRAQRSRCKDLRRQAGSLARQIRQLLILGNEYALESPFADCVTADVDELTKRVRKNLPAEELGLSVGRLEGLLAEIQRRIAQLLPDRAYETSSLPNTDPTRPQNRPHHNSYQLIPDPCQDTVAEQADEPSRSNPRRNVPCEPEISALSLTPVELVRLAPRLHDYLLNSPPKWGDIVDAADCLRRELGISKSLWVEACMTMGRQNAAIAVAIVSAKPPDHFSGSAAGYFHALIKRSASGDLYFAPTIWGMRRSRALE